MINKFVFYNDVNELYGLRPGYNIEGVDSTLTDVGDLQSINDIDGNFISDD